jgi:hypothetical protein
MSAKRSADAPRLSKQLRLQMIEALRLDTTTLSPADEVIVARAGTLRLLLDDMEAQALAGQAIDAGRYTATSEMYERMLRHQYASAVTSDGTSALDSARRRMAELLGFTVDADGNFDEPPVSESQRRIAELEAEIAELKERLASAPLPPQQQSAPASNVVPLPSRSEPSRSLSVHDDAFARSTPAPWRDYISPSGEIMTSGGTSRQWWGPI